MRIYTFILITTAVLSLFNTSCTAIFLSKIKPPHDFSPHHIPPAPDYTQLSGWAALPDRADEADIAPPGYTNKQKSAAADVFFIHPTVFMGQNNWNSSPGKNSGIDELVRYIMISQASVFNGTCRVYAPNYRQATLYSFWDPGTSGTRALDVAYSDVLRAFDYYMKNYNNGRPFFIAGHSQGACHGQRLIMDRVDSTSLEKKFIAGYIFGYPVSQKNSAIHSARLNHVPRRHRPDVLSAI